MLTSARDECLRSGVRAQDGAVKSASMRYRKAARAPGDQIRCAAGGAEGRASRGRRGVIGVERVAIGS